MEGESWRGNHILALRSMGSSRKSNGLTWRRLPTVWCGDKARRFDTRILFAGMFLEFLTRECKVGLLAAAVSVCTWGPMHLHLPFGNLKT